MQEDLVRGYKNFLLGSIKTYFLGCNIIQNEIDFYTKQELKDGLLFFMCIFEKTNPNIFKRIKLQDEVTFKEYLTISTKQEFTLTKKGEKLKEHLEAKLKNHAAMLEFNGIKPEYLGKISTMLKRFEKFWQIIVIFGNKKRVSLNEVRPDNKFNLPQKQELAESNLVINNYKSC